MFNYIYNDNLNIVEVKIMGEAKISDIISLYDMIANDDTLPNNLKILYDLRDYRLNIDHNEAHLVIDSIKKDLTKHDQLREAIIIDKPHETALAQIVEYNNDITNYSMRIFSTENTAMNWLKS